MQRRKSVGDVTKLCCSVAGHSSSFYLITLLSVAPPNEGFGFSARWFVGNHRKCFQPSKPPKIEFKFFDFTTLFEIHRYTNNFLWTTSRDCVSWKIHNARIWPDYYHLLVLTHWLRASKQWFFCLQVKQWSMQKKKMWIPQIELYTQQPLY